MCLNMVFNVCVCACAKVSVSVYVSGNIVFVCVCVYVCVCVWSTTNNVAKGFLRKICSIIPKHWGPE